MSTFGIAVLLAWIAGFVDAVGYVTLAHVFPAHMSGNTVAAGAHLGAGQWSEILRRAFPIPIFVLGVFCGALMGRAMEATQFRRRFIPSFGVEILLLGTFIAFTCAIHTPVAISGWPAYPLVALLAAAMGLQNATLRRARGIAVRTTFISGMLVNMAEKAAGYVARTIDLRRSRRGSAQLPGAGFRRRRDGKQALRYGLLWCGMFVGAASGACLETLWGTIALLLPVAGLLAIMIQDWRQALDEA
jgi:uncharacterized membrane protein YoaK (UPF0700 family)